MAESIHNQIAEALKTRLEAIVADEGVSYWYTPKRVVRCMAYDRLLADKSVGSVYAIRAGQEQHAEKSTGSAATGGMMQAEAEFFLELLRETKAASDNPFGADESTKAIEQDRMVRDVLRALLLDVTLGGLAENIVATSLIVGRDVEIPGWAVAEVRFVVAYTYAARTP